MVQEYTLPIGAQVLARAHGVRFRVWAPLRERVKAVLESGPGSPAEIELIREGEYFSGLAENASAGTRYRYRLDGASPFPDPASRFQPDGSHGSSEVVDPAAFAWSDSSWKGAVLAGQVIYEMHLGTFTEEGTWEAARKQLPELASAGISTLEVMPVADFPGRFGWGYDGVNLFAPSWLYGRPDDMRRFVDEAHGLGLGVILDVVYNHLGPDGNYLREFSPYYFSTRYENEWGDAINFDAEHSLPVREYFASNAAYWIEEFHLDGLRLDATQQIFDSSPEHILTEIVKRARATASGRSIILVAENESQETRLARPIASGGYGIDALWNDDFHHSAMAAMTGRNEAYYSGYLGRPQEFISAVKFGYLYQGQWYNWQKKSRGTPSRGLGAAQFVNYLQNHDQIANSWHGERIHLLASSGTYRAMTALLLLAPNTPMLFQGQEFASSKPFCYFADHRPELARLIHEGRVKFLSQFPSLASLEKIADILDPGNPATFNKCKLDFSERESHARSYSLHKDLIRLRREDPVFRMQGEAGLDGAVLSSDAFLIRYFGPDGGDRLLAINLGVDLRLDAAPEPLLAPPEGRRWKLLWSSEDSRYGGSGTPAPENDGIWRLPGHAAIVMRPGSPADGADAA
jgi:maltooligosyltrehalose trehalohydrolase